MEALHHIQTEAYNGERCAGSILGGSQLSLDSNNKRRKNVHDEKKELKEMS
jgi:hypothetical protein